VDDAASWAVDLSSLFLSRPELVGGVGVTGERVNPEVILDEEEDAAEDAVDTVTEEVTTTRLSSMWRLWHSWAFWLYWHQY
jgi:hypothetical protein